MEIKSGHVIWVTARTSSILGGRDITFDKRTKCFPCDFGVLASLIGTLIRFLMLIFLFEILLMQWETVKGLIDL